MESYRDSFRAQSGLDPIHYVTLPGAAWDAMLRHSARETPIHLITDEQAYKDVRASVMGGLSCIFQPFAQANNPELGKEDYNPKEPVSWISREGGEAHPERHLRPLLHEPRQVQEHERLRGPGQVRAGRGQELRDELRAPDQRLWPLWRRSRRTAARPA